MARGLSGRTALAVVLAVVVAAAIPAGAALAAPAPPGAEPAVALPDPPDPAVVAPDQRDKVLGSGWRQSADRAWTTSGDSNGLHVLVADAREGYAWRTAATLSEPGFDTDLWIGNACVTGSGEKLVVAYAPRAFTNREDTFGLGGFSAVVDLGSGAVTKLPTQSTLAYYSPACGAGETALLTQSAGAEATRLIAVDTATGALAAPITVAGQVTSAVPVSGGGIVAADRSGLVRVDKSGRRTVLAHTSGIPFHLVADAEGAVSFMDSDKGTAHIRRAKPDGTVAALAHGKLAEVGLVSGGAGKAYLTGVFEQDGPLPTSVRALSAPKQAQVSTRGEAVLTSVEWSGQQDPRVPGAATARTRAVSVSMAVPASGQQVSFTVDPAARGADRSGSGRALRPAAPAQRRAVDGGSSSDPVEAERTCAVPRNDPANQVMQPKPRQVEWAVDQAVRDVLTVDRPANWKSLGMPEYTPQGLFPSVPLDGGGHIPAQVMLGVAAQESNLWQASQHALPGSTGNPLIGNFYGRSGNPGEQWVVNWAKADCGYGVTQMTDGMRLAGQEAPGGSPALPYQTQRAVALDFAANVAAGVQKLEQKWNETRRAGLTVNDGDSSKLENWFFALWAYNSGFHPADQAALNDGAWGVGWANNPANPHFPANRDPFLDKTYADAKTPQFWPYPEKVLGWAGHPVQVPESPGNLVVGFRAAWWPGDPVSAPLNRSQVKPPNNVFCDSSNSCVYGDNSHVPNAPDVTGEPAGPCAHQNAAGQYDLKCWYHQPATWKKNCPATCGNELLRFSPGYAYQDDGDSYPPDCDRNALPSNAIIVDEVPDTAPVVRAGCPRTWASQGTFSLDFASDASGHYPAKVDFHQLGAGFGGHFWFAHTRANNQQGDVLRTTGTWRPGVLNGWTRIMVHIPDIGAWTRQADYVINLGDGRTRHRVVNQAWHKNIWVDLGVFPLAGAASVSLSTVTPDGTGDDDVAWNAAAFVPTTRPSAQYVAMGDSYSSGEGVGPFDPNSDYKQDNGNVDACHRSRAGAYPRQVVLPGHSKPIAAEAADGTTSFAFIACSGATTVDVTSDSVDSPPTADDQAGHTDWGTPRQLYHEVAQVDQGYLDEDTTLVTISVGGNDARFSDVLKGCVLTTNLCNASDYKITRQNGVVDPAPLRDYEKDLITQSLGDHLARTYRAIHAKAPNAQILVLGYPQLFEDYPTGGCGGLPIEAVGLLNTFSGFLTTTIGNAVAGQRAAGVNISLVDPTPAWRFGEHWACNALGGDGNSWTNALVNWSESGSGRDVPGKGSFHPKAIGHTHLAELVNAALAGSSTVATVQQRILDYVATRSADGWQITNAQAAEAAQACLALTARAGLVGDPCMHDPIMLPTITDAAGAARNDYSALVDRNPSWVQLGYISNAEKGKVLARDWMNRQKYSQTKCPSPRVPAGYECDEFPFYSSNQGGAWAFDYGPDSPMSTRLEMIPKDENGTEGRLLGLMYRKCGMTSGTIDASASPIMTNEGSPFLTIPLVNDSVSLPNTFYVC
ncbi:NucA/NucB deoxyribonuclease domain-containing protein [Actinocrispum wychmicini]|nr:GDSL-type esterase/lipase family protein [Actinocrispum wychmicini]